MNIKGGFPEYSLILEKSQIRASKNGNHTYENKN